jgi:uncharacterized protein (TIGR02118 family)
MTGAKLIVIYPRPRDIESFERVYQNEHVPMAVEKLVGKTKIVASKIGGSPDGTPLFHRVAEIHFPTMDALQACAASDGGKETIANAVAISSGGVPIFLVAEEETFMFQGSEQGKCARLLWIDGGSGSRRMSPLRNAPEWLKAQTYSPGRVR